MNANRIANQGRRSAFKSLIVAASVAASLMAAAAPAYARDGVWKVGDDYVVRFSQLDLNHSADRQKLLRQVEHAAAKVCDYPQPRTRRTRCEAAAVASALAQATPDIRMAVAAARTERDGVLQASN